MKLSAALSIAFAGIAFGQLGDLPRCATDCVGKYISGNNIGDCPSGDAKCICSSKQFLDGIACCLAGACGQSDQQDAIKFAKQICSANGVTVPDQIVCSSASATAGTASATAGNAKSTSTDSGARQTGAVGALLGGIVAAVAMI